MTRILAVLAIIALCLSSAPAGAQEVADATIAAPAAHEVVLENEHVRVISAQASPGHQSPMHSHPPMVIISMDTARVRLTSPDGTETIISLRPGMVFWADSQAHEWELLSGEVNAIGIEVKSANSAASE
jgi:quercetin dioxygenase-like cupin family protein